MTCAAKIRVWRLASLNACAISSGDGDVPGKRHDARERLGMGKRRRTGHRPALRKIREKVPAGRNAALVFALDQPPHRSARCLYARFIHCYRAPCLAACAAVRVFVKSPPVGYLHSPVCEVPRDFVSYEVVCKFD